MWYKNKWFEAELFFNAGNEERQENFIIYPKSLEKEDYDELLRAVCEPFAQEYEVNGMYAVSQIEQILREKQTYPNPIQNKIMSKWFIAQIKKGAILFRYGYDGRLESYSKRKQYTMEGAFFKDIDLIKTQKHYQKKGIDIIEEIGKQLPNCLEAILINEKKELFEKLKKTHEENQNLESLFNHFYVACYGHEFAMDKPIGIRPLYQMNLLNKLDYTRKRIKEELFF